MQLRHSVTLDYRLTFLASVEKRRGRCGAYPYLKVNATPALKLDSKAHDDRQNRPIAREDAALLPRMPTFWASIVVMLFLPWSPYSTK